MQEDANSLENNTFAYNESPKEKTMGWFKSKLKVQSFLQGIFPSTISEFQQDSSDNSNVPNFTSMRQEKYCIIKNLLIISIAFMLLSTAFQSISALYSPFGILRNTFGISTVSS